MVIPVGDVNPTRRTPVLTVALIAANVVVYFTFNLQLDGAELTCFVYQWAAVPRELLTLRTLPIDATVGPACLAPALAAKNVVMSAFTAMFLHGSLVHLLFNMLFLWIFGNNVEDRLGHVTYLAFYALGGLVSTYAFAVLHPNGVTPVLGASGAIAAVLGAYLVLFPRAGVHTYVPFPLYLLAPLIPRVRVTGWFLIFAVVTVPAWIVLGFWFLTQVTAVSETARTGIAYEAHVSGFLAGVGVMFLLGANKRRPPRRRREATWR